MEPIGDWYGKDIMRSAFLEEGEISLLMDVAHTTVRHIDAGHTWKDVDAAWHVS